MGCIWFGVCWRSVAVWLWRCGVFFCAELKRVKFINRNILQTIEWCRYREPALKRTFTIFLAWLLRILKFLIPWCNSSYAYGLFCCKMSFHIDIDLPSWMIRLCVFHWRAARRLLTTFVFRQLPFHAHGCKPAGATCSFARKHSEPCVGWPKRQSAVQRCWRKSFVQQCLAEYGNR